MRRIQSETGIRREAAEAYLKAAGVAVRSPGGWGRRAPAKQANKVSPDSTPVPAPGRNPSPAPASSTPLHTSESQDAGNRKELVLEGVEDFLPRPNYSPAAPQPSSSKSSPPKKSAAC